MFEVTVNTRRAVVGSKESITTSSAGILVQFTFSEDWDGLSRFAIFRNGEDMNKIPVALPNSNLVTIPAQSCAEEYIDEPLFVGVYGSDGVGTVIIPTIWTSLGVLRPGAVTTDIITPAEPTPDMWAQILAIANEAAVIADECEANEELRIAAEQLRANAETARANAEILRAQAEVERSGNETQRQSAETQRQTAEGARAQAEALRVQAEELRQANEASRASAESDRASAEQTRQANESTRASNETARVTAEQDRVDAESGRVTAETNRVSAETARANAESSRATAEQNRASAETSRVSAESARATAESTRASNEQSRVSAESARVQAEADRAAEFATWEGTIDSKADQTEVDDLTRQISDVEALVDQSPDSLISIVDFTVASATGLTYECDPVNGKVTLINGASSNYPSLSTSDILQNILEIGEEYTLHAKAVQTKGSPHLAMAVRTSASTIIKSYDFTANNTTEGTITFVAESNIAKISLFIGYGASTKGSQAEFSEIVLSKSDGTMIDLLARNISDSHEKTISMQPLPIPFDSIPDEVINSLSGNTVAVAGFFRTSYLDVSKYGLLYYKRIKTTNSASEAGTAFYDKNYHYVGGRRFLLEQDELGYVDDKVIVPRNAVYARMTMLDKATYGDFTLSGVIKSAYITERSSRDNNTARMEFTAHRGQRLYAPENSIPAYEIAGQMGYQWAWIAAIQVSADGTLYVMHDASVDRTTNGTGNVSSLTDVQINALKIDYVVSKQSRYVLSDFTDDELRVPTLEQIVQICLRYNMKMCFRLGGMPSSYVSAGDIAIWDSFAALIKGYRLEETSIFSGSIDQISIVRTLLPNGQVDYFGGSEADADDIIAAFSGYSALATNRSCIIYYENLTLADCKKLHINGFKINVGSGSSLSKADLKTMAEWGVDTVSYLYTPYIPYEEDI
jgi:glycerophosphoryl diester phosphodiesterase